MTRGDFPIVGVGASAGGLEAFHAFFGNMPAATGMAFVVLLHLPPDRKSMLAEILARWTTMRVAEALDGILLQPNCVYVPAPHMEVRLTDGRLHVRQPTPDDEKIYRPVDVFFDSLAQSMREHAVGIVLSGTGSDGALGLKSIKAAGGLTIAQGRNGSAPQYNEMPAAAIATGAVDLVAPIERIPAELLRIQGARPPVPAVADGVTEAARLELCAILRSQLGHDFSGYRDLTFMRRVERRMQVVNATTVAEYIQRLRSDPAEAGSLFRDLLIRVTGFFRDAETFKILAAKAMPRLFANKSADSVVRIWVAGCATGEEPYSLAILVREHLDTLQGGRPRVQIFATDIDAAAIAIARLGRYPNSLLADLSAERKERFFKASHGTYAVSKELRELCTFSVHNLVRDPPFSRLDMVSCRNLLIYMNVQLQAKVIPRLHYALLPHGLLLLGASESTSKHEQLFEPLDKAARLFQRRDVTSPLSDFELSASTRDESSAKAYGAIAPAALPRTSAAEAPSDRFTSFEHASDFGKPKDQALNLGHGGPDTPRRRISGWRRLFRSDSEDLLVDLKRAREDLQSLSEEHQTALEELRSSNEELQSTNEELETSKEELQSVNEELHTVNMRLSEKIDEQTHANSDLRNLFDSIEVATVFLDRHLLIRSFTPAVATLYNLIPSDQGRPLTDIGSHLAYDCLSDDVASVLQSLRPLEQRIARKDQSTHYIMRLLPYRESDGTVSGVLITFVDVTSIVQAEEKLLDADLRKDIFLATLSHELRNPLAPIRTAAYLLESPDLQPRDLARAQAIIARQVEHMSSLLDDLLDVSRVTRGSFVLKRQHVALRVLLDSSVEEAQPAIDAKRHTLRVEYPPNPIFLDADPVRLTQVIGNILTNAAKYTPAGGLISLGAQLESEDVCIFVRDNGIGIESSMLSVVFNMFVRIETAAGPSESGLGIGLALAKGLIELHGGQITAHSAGTGQGSEFVISLPRSLVIAPPGNTADSGSLAPLSVPRRVLIADDNCDGAETLAMFLRLRGHDIHIANSGRDALQIAEREHPEIALLDIGMPDLGGYEVARRMRAEDWGRNIRLIAMTGWGQEKDKRAAIAAGFDRHFTKPVDPDELERSFTSSDNA